MAIILMGSGSPPLVVGCCQRFNCRKRRTFLRNACWRFSIHRTISSQAAVAPFNLAVPKGQAWYLVYRPFRQDDAALVAFRDWLMANVERDPG
jgi:DNA-binding transcriptional LysR family regulator